MNGGKVENKENVLKEKSYSFALKIIEIYKELNQNKKEHIMSKQLLRSGTSIGAMIRESEFAQSKSDFINKLSIGLKEANETEYWISLLFDSDFIDENNYNEIHKLCDEIIRILISSINTAKGNL